MNAVQIFNIISLLILTFFSGIAHASADESRPYKGVFTYKNAERTSYILYKDSFSEAGPIRPRRPLGEQKYEFTESLGGRTEDCSDDKYLCVASGHNILAVPRLGVIYGESYIVRGTIFKIKQCIRRYINNCQVALIEGDCQFVRLEENLLECTPYLGGRSKSPQQGAVQYFIYNEDYGITSMGMESDVVQSQSKMAEVARQYILQGEVGLLAPEHVSKKAR